MGKFLDSDVGGVLQHADALEGIRIDAAMRPQQHQGYYNGQFLIATPTMMGELFSMSVIYLFAHNAGGAMGIIINKPLESLQIAALFEQLGLSDTHSGEELMVYHGGPVEENRGFVLHSNDYHAEDTITHECGLSVTASMSVLREMAEGKGPRKALLGIGYAGWAAGQLESEIEANCWITAPATPAIAFHNDNSAKYGMAAGILGIDMMRFSPTVGRA